MKRVIALLAMTIASLSTHAEETSPAGLWKTIDDSTGKPKAMVRVEEHNGILTGQIVKLFRAENEDQHPRCDKCTDERKDQPIVGMTILKNLQKDGDEYTGGEILDPGNGKTYKSKAKLEDNGHKLNVRGYVGISAFGRTQTWIRED